MQAHQLCLLDATVKTWVLFPSQAQGARKGGQGGPRLLLAGDGPWLYPSQSELFRFAGCPADALVEGSAQ